MIIITRILKRLPWMRYVLFIIGGVLVLILFSKVYNFISLSRNLKAKGKGKLRLFGRRSMGEKVDDRIDRRAGRAFAKTRAKFIKHPDKYSPSGVKYPPKIQRQIRKYMRQHGGALPPDIQHELDKALADAEDVNE